MKKNTLLVAIALFGLSVATTSCRKETKEMLADEITNQDDQEAESTDSDTDNLSEAAVSTSSSTGLRSAEEAEMNSNYGTCATVTKDTLNPNDADTTTVDFGTGCVGKDGRTRKGKVIVIHKGRYFMKDSERTTTFDNFYVNDNKIEGERKVVNTGKNSDGNMQWSVTATNMKVTKADGKTRTWNSSRTRTMIGGQSTKLLADDVYSITGTANGVNAKGESFSSEITDALIKSVDCKYVKQGKITHKVTDKPDRMIDFGDGTCDDKAIVTVKNKTKEITLK